MEFRSRFLMQRQEFVVSFLGYSLAIGQNPPVTEKFYVSIDNCGQKMYLLIAVEAELVLPSSSEHQYQHPRR